MISISRTSLLGIFLMSICLLCPAREQSADSTKTTPPKYTIKDTFNWRKIAAARGQTTNVAIGMNFGNLIFLEDVSVNGTLPLLRNLSARAEFGLGFRGAKSETLKEDKVVYCPFRLEAGIRYWPWYVNSELYLQTGLQYHPTFSWDNNSPFHLISNDVGLTLAFGYFWNLTRDWAIDLGIGGWVGWSDNQPHGTSRRLTYGGNNQFFLEWDRIMIGVSYVF